MKRKIYDDQLIVLTGASGMIGSHVIRYLNERGLENLILVDDFHHSPKWKNLVGTRFVDFVSKNEIFEWLEGRENDLEAIIHLGACTSTTEADGDYLLKNNYRFSVNLAEYALHHDLRFIYASSAATYGDGKEGFVDDHERLDELKPMNLYGYSKHMFDVWLKRQGSLDDVVGLKYFNIYGPYEYHKGRMASMVFHMTKQILEEGKVRLFCSSEPKRFGDGDQRRDFLYVKDAARMTCEFLEIEEGGIYNVGSGQAETWNQMAQAIFSAMGKEPCIEYIPMPKDLIGKYQNYTQADMTKYRQITKQNPATYSLEEGVKDYVTHYLIDYYQEHLP